MPKIRAPGRPNVFLEVRLDGLAQSGDEVVLVDDGQTHEVWVLMGEKIIVDEAEPLTSEMPQPEEAR